MCERRAVSHDPIFPRAPRQTSYIVKKESHGRRSLTHDQNISIPMGGKHKCTNRKCRRSSACTRTCQAQYGTAVCGKEAMQNPAMLRGKPAGMGKVPYKRVDCVVAPHSEETFLFGLRRRERPCAGLGGAGLGGLPSTQ